MGDLAHEYHRSLRWVQTQLDAAPVSVSVEKPQRIIAIADTTFFGRGYGILVIRCPRLKKNIHFHEVRLETPDEYRRARYALEQAGWVIEAAVIDGRRGLLQVFGDVPVQMCQFHQIAIMRRYLTSRPKLDAGKELRALTLTLSITNEAVFTELLDLWFQRWEGFLKERTCGVDERHWHYTHKRIRSAYRSLSTTLPYLFTYQRYPHLHIPNTTNSLDGYFGRLKHLLNVHRGLTVRRRYRLIQEILS